MDRAEWTMVSESIIAFSKGLIEILINTVSNAKESTIQVMGALNVNRSKSRWCASVALFWRQGQKIQSS